MEESRFVTDIANSIRSAQEQLRWRPGSASRHLLKRKLRGHLPTDVTLNDYHNVIKSVLETRTAEVYIHFHGNNNYPTIVSTIDGKAWLVMLTIEGIIETAFIVENPETYFSSARFKFISPLSEILS